MARPKKVTPDEWQRFLGLRAELLLKKIEKMKPETSKQKILLDWLDRGVEVKARKF